MRTIYFCILQSDLGTECNSHHAISMLYYFIACYACLTRSSLVGYASNRIRVYLLPLDYITDMLVNKLISSYYCHNYISVFELSRHYKRRCILLPFCDTRAYILPRQNVWSHPMRDWNVCFPSVKRRCCIRQAPQLEEEVFVAGQGESVNREEHLRIITLEPGKVEGEYRPAGDDESGVYFLSEVRKDSRSLLITTLQGEQLYRAVSPRNKDILVSLMGNDFLLKNYETIEGRTALQGFLVPAESVAEIEMNLDEPDGIDERLFSANDDADSLSVMRRSYAKLHRRVERAHFVHASEKLGRDIGVLGSEHPAAMSLYVLAMRLAGDEGVARDAIPSRAQSISKAQRRCPAPKLYCSNSKACCGKCPIGNGCLGMCGPPELHLLGVGMRGLLLSPGLLRSRPLLQKVLKLELPECVEVHVQLVQLQLMKLILYTLACCL